MDKPLNVDDVEIADLKSTSSDDAEWVGGYFAYGGSGAKDSCLIYFAIPPGKRLGRHTDTREETQFFIGGSGQLLLDDGPQPVKKGDLICRKEQYAIEGKEKPKDADALNHQCLVASVNTDDTAKPTVTTVNGNGYYQAIHVRTEPLTHYWGYYDSRTETDVGAFEARLKKRYGHA